MELKNETLTHHRRLCDRNSWCARWRDVVLFGGNDAGRCPLTVAPIRLHWPQAYAALVVLGANIAAAIVYLWNYTP